MLQLRNEHGGYTIKGRTSLAGNGLQYLQRIEAAAGEHDRRTMRHGRQYAQDHAEAVIQRHRDTYAVIGREPHTLADKESVVDDIEVRQRRTLRRARGAARELDIEDLVRVQIRLDRRQQCRVKIVSRGLEVIERERAVERL